LGERAIYCDTDSVIYIQPGDETGLIETGAKLGDMTSELRPTEYVSEFMSGGPENYAYKKVNTVTARTDTIRKVMVKTLNYCAKQLVNYVIKDMILGSGEPTVLVHTEKKIKRKRNGEVGTVAIINEPEDKMYRIWLFKRR